MFFANLEATTNAAVLNHLANVRVKLAGETVPGIFRKPSSVAALGPGAADTSPTVTLASAAVMAEPVDKLIEIAGVPYIIVAAAPDGTGLTMLTLECTQ
jgi:hypothetical protein